MTANNKTNKTKNNSNSKSKVKKKMKFKKIIIILTIASLIIVAGAIGGSYAYYSLSETDIDIQTKELSAGQVIFSNSNYIKMNTGVPIPADAVEDYASKSIFTIVPPNNIEGNYDFAFNVSLNQLYIDEDLRVEDFKYKLECMNNNSKLDVSLNDDEEDTSYGDGNSFNTEEVSFFLGTYSSEENDGMLDNNTICTLYIWLEDNDENQNDLMGLNFSSFIKVNAAVRTR